jgi:hypothetical protein
MSSGMSEQFMQSENRPELSFLYFMGVLPMLIACLDFRNTSYGGRFRYQGFSSIAQELGHQVKPISHDGSPDGVLRAYDEAGKLIQDASAFFIPNSLIFNCMVRDHPAHPIQIRKRVESGARMLVTPYFGQPAMESWNGFLAPFDLLVTTTRIHPTIFNPAGVAPKDVAIKRCAHSFRDARLFQGVNEVVLHQPVAIWYGGESLPILLATENEMPIDGEKDELPIPETCIDPSEVLPDEWNARELACMAVWCGENDGAVLASMGPGFYDPGIEPNCALPRMQFGSCASI